MPRPTTYRVRWLACGPGMVLQDTSFTVAQGRVVRLGGDSESTVVDWRDCLVTPGLVNAHTHLDLSWISERVPEQGTRIPSDGGMAGWLKGAVQARLQSPDELSPSVERAVRRLLDSGTAYVGDIAARFDSAPMLARLGLAGVVYPEVIGLKPERFEPLWKSAIERFNPQASPAYSLSPHAPYSTSREVYLRASMIASDLPRATHWCESDQELEFLRTGQGPIRAFLESIGAWADTWTPTDDPWTDYLSDGRWTLIHGNFLSDEDIDQLATNEGRARVAGVVYCPRTHAYFGHPPHPWRKLLRAGVPVALGTDSLASNPDLSVLEEARWLFANDPGADPQTLLTMLTQHGMNALFGDGVSSTIEVGSPARVSVFRIEDAGIRSPLEALLGHAQVVSVLADGVVTPHQGPPP